MALSLVSMTTGLCLSGRGNLYRRTSRRPITPATMPPVPTPQRRPPRPDACGNRADREPRPRVHEGVLGVHEGLSNQDGTAYSRPFGCTFVARSVRIQHYLVDFHICGKYFTD